MVTEKTAVRYIGWMIVPAIVLCVVIGCGQDGEPVAEASGVVTFNGKPVENAKVAFLPKEGGSRFSHGTTDAQGRFKLSTNGLNDGGLIGKHTVTVSKVDVPTEGGKGIDAEKMKEGGIAAGMTDYGKMMSIGGSKPAEVKNEIPDKFKDAKTSGIELEITEKGPNEFQLKLE